MVNKDVHNCANIKFLNIQSNHIIPVIKILFGVNGFSRFSDF